MNTVQYVRRITSCITRYVINNAGLSGCPSHEGHPPREDPGGPDVPGQHGPVQGRARRHQLVHPGLRADGPGGHGGGTGALGQLQYLHRMMIEKKYCYVVFTLLRLQERKEEERTFYNCYCSNKEEEGLEQEKKIPKTISWLLQS